MQIINHLFNSKLLINSKVKVAFAQSDLETAKWLSELAGMKTKKIINKSRQTLNYFNGTESSLLSGRPLMMAQEVLRLSPRKTLLIIEGCHPLICQKLYWDKDAILKSRVSEV